MSPDFRFASIDEGLFRESALLYSDAFDRVLHPEKEYCKMYVFFRYNILLTMLFNWTTSMQIFSRLKLLVDHLVIILAIREIK